MADDICYEATYPQPTAAVWRALTTPEGLRSWLMETTFREAVVGHRFEFRDKPRMGWSGVTQCEVVEVVPERRFVFSFGDAADDAPATRIAWELEPLAHGGTRVRFRHSGFTGVKGWLMRAGMAKGWERIVKHAIPFVLEEMGHGRVPTRERTKEISRARARGSW